jgi:hypothetical protein
MGGMAARQSVSTGRPLFEGRRRSPGRLVARNADDQTEHLKLVEPGEVVEQLAQAEQRAVADVGGARFWRVNSTAAGIGALPPPAARLETPPGSVRSLG